jgi:hypothetical protein
MHFRPHISRKGARYNQKSMLDGAIFAFLHLTALFLVKNFLYGSALAGMTKRAAGLDSSMFLLKPGQLLMNKSPQAPQLLWRHWCRPVIGVAFCPDKLPGNSGVGRHVQAEKYRMALVLSIFPSIAVKIA